MSDLAKKSCIPCRGGVPPLKGTQLADLQEKLKNDWKIIDEHHLEKEYSFKNFKMRTFLIVTRTPIILFLFF